MGKELQNAEHFFGEEGKLKKPNGLMPCNIIFLHTDTVPEK